MTNWTLQDKTDKGGKAILLKEDGGHLETEDGGGIILEQADVGSQWSLSETRH